MAQACNPGSLEVEVGQPEAQSYPWLHIKSRSAWTTEALSQHNGSTRAGYGGECYRYPHLGSRDQLLCDFEASLVRSVCQASQGYTVSLLKKRNWYGEQINISFVGKLQNGGHFYSLKNISCTDPQNRQGTLGGQVTMFAWTTELSKICSQLWYLQLKLCYTLLGLKSHSSFCLILRQEFTR